MDEAALRTFLSVSFHFFTTGQPETVPLGPEHALPVHGGEVLPIYYGEHLRTSWYGIATRRDRQAAVPAASPMLPDVAHRASRRTRRRGTVSARPRGYYRR